MANPRFNNQVHPGMSPAKPAAANSGSGKAPGFKQKPGFQTGAPGKKQSDRSGGVTRCKTHPASDGL